MIPVISFRPRNARPAPGCYLLGKFFASRRPGNLPPYGLQPITGIMIKQKNTAIRQLTEMAVFFVSLRRLADLKGSFCFFTPLLGI
jgi:hypothetical protein